MNIKPLLSITESAADLLLRMQKDAQIAHDKGGGDFATEADYASEQKVMSVLAEIFPTTPVVSEESADICKVVPETCFICDPLDGTYAYKQGMRYYGVSLGYKKAGKPLCGAIIMPSYPGRIVLEETGNPLVDGKPVRLSAQGVPERLTFATEINYCSSSAISDHLIKPLIEQKRLGLAYNPCAAVRGFHALLTGEIDAYINPGLKVWDCAVGIPAIERAGGYVCDLRGEPLRWDKIEMHILCAANKEIADFIVSFTKEMPV